MLKLVIDHCQTKAKPSGLQFEVKEFIERVYFDGIDTASKTRYKIRDHKPVTELQIPVPEPAAINNYLSNTFPPKKAKP